MSFSHRVSDLVDASDDGLHAIGSSWERVPLGDVCDILNGFPFKSRFFNETHGVPVIRIRDVTSGKSVTLYSGEIPEGYWVEPADIVVGMDGDFNCRMWPSSRGLLNQRVCKLTPNEEFLEKKFLAYALPGYLSLINENTHSITVKHLSSKTISEIPCPLPPREEQRRIVSKLDKLYECTDRARKELSHIPSLIEHYKQAILAAAFCGDLTAEWRLEDFDDIKADGYLKERRNSAKELRSSSGIRRDIKTSMIQRDKDLAHAVAGVCEYQPLPNSWAWIGIGEVFGVFIGATPSRKKLEYWGGSIPWVSSGEVAFCRISSTEEYISEEGLVNASTRLHPIGTVLLGMIGEGKTRGQAAILDIEACNNQNCAAIRVSEAGFPPEYVYWYLVHQYEKTRRVGAGNNQPALNKDRVQRLLFPLPPPEEAVLIVEKIETAFRWIDSLSEHVCQAQNQTTRLNQEILRRAFQGELTLRDPNDEPASVLLERIRADREARPTDKRRSRNNKTATG